ncbi:MAG TPA: aspartate/glutamate racemase family protein [Steroidobacteraceae bacterium]|jgi:aspartate racemase|nr:aspartate/glutamate racemase family protein [Steroidobacteraceae bacterium]
MKTIGLIGGMSWESTIPYYRIINETVRERLGGLHCARVILFSVDFAEIERLQHQGDWEQAGRSLALAARSLERAGADFMVLCTNTMHKVAAAIESAVSIPLLHIADAVATTVTAAGHRSVGLLGTRFTMEQPFYKERLHSRFGLSVLVPPANDQSRIHRIIYDELCLGKVLPQSRAEFQRVMDDLVSRGADAMILGCTEISLLVGSEDASVPLFDTTRIHAQMAAAMALQTSHQTT